MANLTCVLHLRRALASCTCVSFCVALRGVECCMLRAACCVLLRVCVVHLRRPRAFCFVWRCVLHAACCVVLRVASCQRSVGVSVAGRCAGTYVDVSVCAEYKVLGCGKVSVWDTIGRVG